MEKDSGLRIEFYEKVSEMTDEERTYYIDELGMKPPKAKTTYRRVYPLLSSIDMPKEIPDCTTDTMLIYNDGTFTVVKGNYDDICDAIDLREQLLEQSKSEEYE